MTATVDTLLPNDTSHKLVGATVESIYYAVPSHYAIGDTFSDLSEAIDCAVDCIHELASGARGTLASTTTSVVTRVVFSHANGGTTDLEMERLDLDNNSLVYFRKYPAVK